jgi:hypothetical protein
MANIQLPVKTFVIETFSVLIGSLRLISLIITQYNGSGGSLPDVFSAAIQTSKNYTRVAFAKGDGRN